MTSSHEDPQSEGARERILAAAHRLITEGGLASLTTRSLAAAAEVQAPTLYRLFGDKRGLLDAVAEQGMAEFVAAKVVATPHEDAVQDLSEAWDGYVAFGLANPAVFAIMNEVGADGGRSAAASVGIAVLKARVRRIALSGRLGVAEPLAVAVIHAAGVGVVTTLLALQQAERDMQVSRITFAGVLQVLLVDEGALAPQRDLAAMAIGLRARIDVLTELSPGERLLLAELLDRLAT